MKKLKFTVFIPTYQAERWLESCLRSIRDQDYPKELVEVLVVDGGSKDRTLELARASGAKVLPNPQKLAHFAFNICAQNATGDLIIQFASDNELVGVDWLSTVNEAFSEHQHLAAVWGRQVALPTDAPVNHYYALIQNDPLSFFVNRNLQGYLKIGGKIWSSGREGCLFRVDPERSLVWGANGLVLRLAWVRDAMLATDFVGDNDVFQMMIEAGHNEVAYFPTLQIVHHHVTQVSDWLGKWRRNFLHHFLGQHEKRNMRWGMDRDFKFKLVFWIIYAGIPIFSSVHAVLLAIRDRNARWFYHPLLSWLQLVTYLRLTLGTREGREFLQSWLFGKKAS